MGSLQAESDEKQEMDDSGCIQDETAPSKHCDTGDQGVQLLDLSDDVLLMILRHLTPRDLKALGFTCPRLGALILDRSLWQTVDAREQPWTRARLRWYLSRALHAGTRELLLSGFAREARECLGHVNQTREEIEAAKLRGKKDGGKEEDNNNQPEAEPECVHRIAASSQRVIEVPALGPNAQLIIDDREDQRPNSPSAFAWPCASEPLISDSSCPGPQFTLTPRALRQLAATCPALSTLALDYCNINCNETGISMFPPTLKNLSLRGSKCYNVPLDRSFLFKIQDTLPELETLDVSECEWMEPASLLPVSKLPALKHLYAQDCLRLTEFVAYASLATRYGFIKLETLDLRGSPVGDSEVSALGWLAALRCLRLAPARAPPPPRQHSHHKQDRLPSPRTPPRDMWEDQEPDYFKIKEPDHSPATSPEKWSPENHTWQAKLNGTAASFSSPTNGASSSSPSPSRIIHASPLPSTSNPLPDSIISSLTMSSNFTITRSVPRSNSTSPPKTCCSIITPLRPKSPPTPGPSQASKRKTSSPTPGPSKRKRDDSSSSEEDDDDNVPLKSLIGQGVNNGASTSKEEPQKEKEDEEGKLVENQDDEAPARHHVLYVNVGQRLHAVYRLSLDNEHVVSFNRNPAVHNMDSRNIFQSPPSHIDATSLVTDSAIRRFGRADGEDVNYVHIGPNGPYPGFQVPGARPDRSSLTHLSVTGFRTITDRSLDHLATSAPFLRFLDLSETNVTDAGVRNFRILRPDCEVIYSKYQKKVCNHST